MRKFTDLLDNYLLALGLHNQAHGLHESDPLRWGQEFRDASEALVAAKSDLNSFVDSLATKVAEVAGVDPISRLVQP